VSFEPLTPQERAELVRRHGDWAYERGTLKADWLLRLGPDGCAARCKANRRNMRISRARLALWRRRGYWFDDERRLRAPVTPGEAPVRAAAQRGRSSRSSRRRRATRATRTSRGDPDSDSDSDSPSRRLRVVPLARFRHDVDAWLEAVGR
jgi:hypothetical protein